MASEYWKPCGKDDTGDDYTLFNLDEQNATERYAIGKDAWLLVYDDNGWINFAAFDFLMGPATQNGVVVSPAVHHMLFHGEGPAGSLRECRHIWWGDPGDGGCTHSLNFAVVERALQELRRWFDGD